MNARRLAVLAAIFGVGLSASSCGGGDSGGDGTTRATSRPAPHVIPGRVVSRANRDCRSMLRSVKRIAERTRLSDYGSGLELTTEAFAEPGLKLVKRLARRQRALQAAAADPRFDAYADLFDPIIVLGEQRLAAGRADDLAQSEQLQELLTDLGAEQRETAGDAGLRDCDVDFLAVLVRKAFG